MFSHDEGACWAPTEIYNTSIILMHWGRLDPDHKWAAHPIQCPACMLIHSALGSLQHMLQAPGAAVAAP